MRKFRICCQTSADIKAKNEQMATKWQSNANLSLSNSTPIATALV
jgi:hypothetical protein